MPKLVTHSPDNPEFARVVAVASLRRAPEFRFDIVAEAVEAAAVAALLDAQAVDELRLAGSLRAAGEGWLLEARLTAVVVQSCVVTLEPVTARVDVPVRRRFEPMALPQVEEIEIDSLEDDDREPLGDRIDLGRVAVEALALALPAYPRSAGAALTDTDRAALGLGCDEDSDKPFASLAALRAKMRGDS